MTFAIEWHVYEEEWARAAKVSQLNDSEPAVEAQVYDELLSGILRFSEGSRGPEVFDDAVHSLPGFFTFHGRVCPVDQSPFVLGFRLRILDFALQLCEILGPRNFIESTQAVTEDDEAFGVIYDSLGPTRIFFRHRGGEVAIYSHQDPGVRLRVKSDEFFAACHAFLRQFATELRRRAPLLLRWNALKRLSNSAPNN